jgi:hypothetical protein
MTYAQSLDTRVILFNLVRPKSLTLTLDAASNDRKIRLEVVFPLNNLQGQSSTGMPGAIFRHENVSLTLAREKERAGRSRICPGQRERGEELLTCGSASAKYQDYQS